METNNSFGIFVAQLKVDSKLFQVLIGASDCICKVMILTSQINVKLNLTSGPGDFLNLNREERLLKKRVKFEEGRIRAGHTYQSLLPPTTTTNDGIFQPGVKKITLSAKGLHFTKNFNGPCVISPSF